MRSTSSHRNAQSSPRRAPVTIASQTNMPQAGSFQAWAAIRAACSEDGGVGSEWLVGGESASATGFVPSQRQRTARLQASLRIP